MQFNLGVVLLAAVILIVAIAVLWWLFAKLYQRSTSELSFVRTGLFGEKVAIARGALVIPVLHEVTRVNMNTMRISIAHDNENALITQDRLRVNIGADFYVRVAPETAAVAAAARTLGSRTTSVDGMRQLLQARFDDALRTAAAEQTMEALHENRGAFSARVRELAALGLHASGLEIDSVSIAKFDQASREFFNPNNAFDAAGLTKLTAEIEDRRRKRNEIERDSQVAIQRKNLAAEQQMLELQKEEEYARLQQEREIAIRRAEQQSVITVQAAEMKRSSQVAEVGANEAIEMIRLASDRTLREEKIRLEQRLEIAETERRKTLEIAQQAIEIEIAAHSQLRNAAHAQAELSRATAVRAEESVAGARELERAERDKQLALLTAARDSEVAGIALVERAVAEAKVAEHKAVAVRVLAAADAAAEDLRRDSDDKRGAMTARARRSLNEAENVMTPEAMSLRAKLAAIGQVEAVIRESVKPLEHISEIKILHVDGLGGHSPGAVGAADAGGATLTDQIMNSALKYKLQAPLVEAVLKSAGIESGTLTDLVKPPPGG
jgi:uncharacterized membrane protein YqiK